MNTTFKGLTTRLTVGFAFPPGICTSQAVVARSFVSHLTIANVINKWWSGVVTLLLGFQALDAATPFTQAIPFTSIEISNGRASGNERLAIDGRTGTFSYLTLSTTLGPQAACLFLGAPTNIDGFAWVKRQQDLDNRGEGHIHSSLSIRISTDPIGTPLGNRRFLPVAGMVSGYAGAFRVQVDAGGSVNSDGTISREFGTGLADGLSISEATYAVSFKPVTNATAILFGFEDIDGFTHYPTVEFYALSAQPTEDLGAVIRVSAVDICWLGSTNQRYQVQYSTDLGSTNWFDLGSAVPGTGTNCVTDSVGETQKKFYRITRVP